ncbi:putative surface protein (partial adhesin) [Acinetobacter baylyi ADP1]|uniref:Putative surface protein (Partial adhesin) n=7 Tax=Acinetobacter TaxID=469 RepID=Q6FBS6_ACIAD|nr:putative surface protein (partial adhesin) [Acinetobacter baylyi ADP1]
MIVRMKKIDTTFKKTTLGVYILAATLSSVTFADNLALGNGATNTKGIDNAVAIGDSALASQTGAVALGAGSNTATNATAASDVTIKDGNGNDITISASQFAGNSNIDSGDQVSVGSVGNERQIKNVAAGEVSSTSTDAVNGSQLYAVADTLAKEIKNTQTEVTEGKNVTVTSTTGANGQTVYNVATKDDVDFDKVTVGKVVVDKDNGIDAGDTKITGVAAGDVSATSTDAVNGSQLYSAAAKATTEVTEGKNVTVTSTTGANGQTVYNVATKDDVDFDKVTVGKVVIDKDSGIDAGDTKITSVAAGDVSATSTDAVNGSQLYSAAAKATTEVTEGKNVTVTSTTGANGQTVYNVATKDDVDFDKVTVGKVVIDKDSGIDAGNTKITGVAAGDVSATSTDAVNGSQLYSAAAKATTEVTEGKNVTVTSTTGANGQTVYNVATKDDVDFDKVTVGKVVIDKDSGIDAGNTKITNVAAGDVNATSTDAVNGSQLYSAAAKATTEVTEGKNITVTSTTGANGQAIYNVATSDDVTFKSVTSDQVTVGNVSINQSGINAGNTQITNVAAGTKTTDAVNLGQLQSTVSIFGGGSTVNSDGSITNPTYNVNGGTYNNVGDALGALNQVDIDLGDRITNLQQTFNNRINDVEDKLSAGVASALALESAPYVAGKYTYAAGSGFYNGQSAIGVSLRKTADNGRWSLTGGVAAASQGEASFRIGINGVID